MLQHLVRALTGANVSIRGPLAYLFVAMPIAAAGCNGCGSGDIQCDANGNCTICDSYGCHDANGQPSGTSTGSSAQGGSGQGGSGQTGSGHGGAGSTVTGQGGTGGSLPTCDPATVTCPCNDKSQCSNGDYCLGGLCLPGCNHDFECGSGNVCADGLCVAGCSGEVACASGYKCLAGGCVVDGQNPQCTGPTQCTTNLCVGGFCTTGCTVNTDCPNGQLCDAGTHSCFPDPTPKPVCSTTCPGIGQECGADGYCHYTCNSVQQCKLIDNRFVACDMSICKTQEEVSPQCDLTTPCPNNQSCISNNCVP